MAHPNRKYKDTLFRDLFGSPERKGNALALYNALAGTDYPDPAALELTTLDDVIYLNVKNDVSFLVGGEMVLLEHQSTPNPNMPLRGLLYFARLYAAHVERLGLNLYGRRRVALPAPRYFVLYSGAEERPDREVLRFSDSFGGRAGCLEVEAVVLNVNEGRSPAIMGACGALRGYAAFVGKVRRGARGGDLAGAVSRAVDECIAEGVLADCFRARKAEVIDMFMTEYDAERQRELDRRDGWEDGRLEGRAEGRAELLAELVRDGVLSVASAAERSGMTPEQFAERAAADGLALG